MKDKDLPNDYESSSLEKLTLEANKLIEDLESQKILGFTFQSGLNYSNLYLNTLSEEIKNDYLLKLRQVICITNYQKSIAKG